MNDFAQFLNERNADADTLQQAMRNYFSRRSDFLSPEEMREQMLAVTTDSELFDQFIELLQKDSRLLESLSLALLSDAWTDEKERLKIQSAIDGAKTKMPVIEVGILAMTCMYAMFLVQTGGIRSTTLIQRDNGDGTFETVQRTEYWGPTGPLKALASLFTPSSGQKK